MAATRANVCFIMQMPPLRALKGASPFLAAASDLPGKTPLSPESGN